MNIQEEMTSPLTAAANLIGTVTCLSALSAARISFGNWQGAAHRCMLVQLSRREVAIVAHEQHFSPKP